MAKDMFGNKITNDIYGNPLKSKSKRQPVARSQKNRVWESQKGKCSFCGRRLNPSSTHYDHIKEVSRGGKSTTKNLRALCSNCHNERHDIDRALKADKKKRGTTPSKGTWVNPLTGKKEKFDPMRL